MSSKSNSRLFIDANIYLSFYSSDAVELQELLLPLEEARESIIVTDEIVDEVVRNRYRIVRESFDLCHQQTLVPLKEAPLPKHLTKSLKTKLDQWTDHRKDLAVIAKKQNKLFSEIKKKSLQLVYNGSDEVSETLDKIFSQSISPTPEEIANATLRKAVGNPPGKKQKMGDELNWEQALNQLDGIDTFIIVSNDSDYRVEKEDIRLHPLLVSEIKKRYPKLEVTLYKSLSPAINYFNSLQPKSEKLATLPRKEILEKIAIEEQELVRSRTSFFDENFIIDYIGEVSAVPLLRLAMSRHCKVCGEVTDHVDVKGTLNGTRLYRSMCFKCGLIE